MRVRVFHNNARDDEGRHVAWDRGYLSGDTVTEVFAYDVPADEHDPLNVENIFDLFNVGDDPSFGKPDSRALDYRARLNRNLSKGDVVAAEDGDLTLWWAVAGVGWDEIDPPTIANETDHGTTPIDATEEQITVRKVAGTIVDQAEGMFAGHLRLVALAGYPISGGMFDLRDETEIRLLDLARELATAQAAYRLTRRGKPVPGPNGEPASEEFWETRATALAVELVDAVATVKRATAHTN